MTSGLRANQKFSSKWETKIRFLEMGGKKGWKWMVFEWIWMVLNQPCLNIFVTKTQQIRFNPTQSTKPAGSSWIFINVQDLILRDPPWNSFLWSYVIILATPPCVDMTKTNFTLTSSLWNFLTVDTEYIKFVCLPDYSEMHFLS